MVTLVVKIDLEKNKENYQKVVEALADYDLVSVAWETETKATGPVAPSGKTGDDLGANLSSAVNRALKRQASE